MQCELSLIESDFLEIQRTKVLNSYIKGKYIALNKCYSKFFTISADGSLKVVFLCECKDLKVCLANTGYSGPS